MCHLANPLNGPAQPLTLDPLPLWRRKVDPSSRPHKLVTKCASGNELSGLIQALRTSQFVRRTIWSSSSLTFGTEFTFTKIRNRFSSAPSLLSVRMNLTMPSWVHRHSDPPPKHISHWSPHVKCISIYICMCIYIYIRLYVFIYVVVSSFIHKDVYIYMIIYVYSLCAFLPPP